MTRQDAAVTLARLAVGLQADAAGAARLLERISVETDAETLRDALMECGAAAVLDMPSDAVLKTAPGHFPRRGGKDSERDSEKKKA